MLFISIYFTKTVFVCTKILVNITFVKDFLSVAVFIENIYILVKYKRDYPNIITYVHQNKRQCKKVNHKNFTHQLDIHS